jgi:putative spermidine/putrescine transport system substrate-binding protein
VLLLPGDVARQACQQNELQKLDFDKLGGKDQFLPQGMQDCGMGAVTTAVAVAWDRDKYHGNPPGWAEFWDVARVPGKRGLPRDPRFTLEIALLADAVAPADVYRTLRTKDGVDRAFRKLDQLRPYVVWWTSAAEAVRILESGDVLLAAAPTGNIAVAAHGGKALSVQWTNALSSVLYWSLPSNLPAAAQDAAGRFLSYAATTATQAKLQTAIPYGGLVKGANENLPPDVAEWSTGTTAHQQAMLATDEQFWRDNDEKLSQRFEDWLRK